jgi:hypothetical protein
MAHDGCLLGYGPNFAALWRRPADYVARILRGEKPGELPICMPKHPNSGLSSNCLGLRKVRPQQPVSRRTADDGNEVAPFHRLPRGQRKGMQNLI